MLRRGAVDSPYFVIMTSSSSAGRRRSPLLQVFGSIAIAALSALSWFAWMGWDQEYQLDPRTGVYSGPFEAWQVIGCALSLLVLLVGALWVGVEPLWGSAALTLGFTTVWTVQAAARDDTGLFGVGMVMLLLGLGMASALVSSLTRRWHGRWDAQQ